LCDLWKVRSERYWDAFRWQVGTFEMRTYGGNNVVQNGKKEKIKKYNLP